jgi:hypothetical protein
MHFSNCVTRSLKCICHRVMVHYKIVDQHVKLCTWGLGCEFVCFLRVITIGLLKISIFNLWSVELKKSWNLIGNLVSMCNCAPWVSLVDLSSICRVIAFDLVKTISLCCLFVHWVLVFESTNFTGIMINITVKLCTCDFACRFFSVLLELLPLTYYKFAIFNLFMHSSCVRSWIYSVFVKFLPFT